MEPEDAVVPVEPDVGKLSDEEILATLERNQLTKVKRLAGTHTEDAIKTLSQIMKNKKNAPAPRVTAARAILDYAHGRPAAQQTPREQSSNDSLKVVILKLSDGTTEEIQAVDVTPGAAPDHEKPHSAVAGVKVLEIGL